jgi:hypothetical protein
LDGKLFNELLNGTKELTSEIEEVIVSKAKEINEGMREKEIENLVSRSVNPLEFVRQVALSTQEVLLSDEKILRDIQNGTVGDLFPSKATAKQLKTDYPHYFNSDLYFLHQLEQHKNPHQKKMVEQWLVGNFGRDFSYAGHTSKFILNDIKNKIKEGELSLCGVTLEQKIKDLKIKKDLSRPQNSE